MCRTAVVSGCLLAVPLCASVPFDDARADEPLFGYVKTTDLLPQGKWEIEQWITNRYRQSQGSYTDVEMRTELEYGITNDLKGSVYLNYSYVNARANDVNGGTSGLNIPENHDPTQPYRATRYDGVSGELVYRVLSPYKDPIGLAFYFEPSIGPRSSEIELRVIAQKNFLDDRLVFAANLWTEYEWEKKEGNPFLAPDDPEFSPRTEKATQLEFDLGVSYRFAPRWSAGLEFRNHNEFAGHTWNHSNQEHTAYFFGPNVHYASEKWWATLTCLWQTHAKAFSEDNRLNTVNGKVYGDEHTRIDGLRLLIGYLF
jgi:hypothetical protein